MIMIIKNLLDEAVYRSILNEGTRKSFKSIFNYVDKTAPFLNSYFEEEWIKYSGKEKIEKIEKILNRFCMEEKIRKDSDGYYTSFKKW